VSESKAQLTPFILKFDNLGSDVIGTDGLFLPPVSLLTFEDVPALPTSFFLQLIKNDANNNIQ